MEGASALRGLGDAQARHVQALVVGEYQDVELGWIGGGALAQHGAGGVGDRLFLATRQARGAYEHGDPVARTGGGAS